MARDQSIRPGKRGLSCESAAARVLGPDDSDPIPVHLVRARDMTRINAQGLVSLGPVPSVERHIKNARGP
jgi:hypothetical protein